MAPGSLDILAALRPGDIVVVAAIIVAIVLLMLATQRRARESGPSPRDYAREQISRLRDQQGIRDDMEELLAQLQELSRQINAQADTKFAKLEAAVADADKRIERLAQSLRAADAKSAKLAAAVADADKRIEPLAQSLRTAEGSPAAEAPAEDAASAPEKEEQVEQQDPLRRQIFELADEGMSALEIARQTGRNTGEIELILNLRQTAGRPPEANHSADGASSRPS